MTWPTQLTDPFLDSYSHVLLLFFFFLFSLFFLLFNFTSVQARQSIHIWVNLIQDTDSQTDSHRYEWSSKKRDFFLFLSATSARPLNKNISKYTYVSVFQVSMVTKYRQKHGKKERGKKGFPPAEFSLRCWSLLQCPWNKDEEEGNISQKGCFNHIFYQPVPFTWSTHAFFSLSLSENRFQISNYVSKKKSLLSSMLPKTFLDPIMQQRALGWTNFKIYFGSMSRGGLCQVNWITFSFLH